MQLNQPGADTNFQKVSIVVPFYNERESVRPLYARLTDVMNRVGLPYELVFVDDGSRD